MGWNIKFVCNSSESHYVGIHYVVRLLSVLLHSLSSLLNFLRYPTSTHTFA